MNAPDFSTTLVQLRAAKGGDRQALNEILVRYQPRLRDAVALSLGKLPGQVADLDDILQEVMIAACTRLDQFEQRSEGTFMSWLATIAINKVRDHHRHAAREKRGGGRVRGLDDVFASSSVGLPVPDNQPRPSQIARAHEIEEAKKVALTRLDPRYRDIIVDRDILGMTYEELAVKLGYKTEAPPRALHSRALSKLRELLKSFDDGSAPTSSW